MDELIKQILEGESDTVEFKKTTASLREGIETVCGFANHRGGYILFGVDDNGKVIGGQVTDDTLKNIANEIKYGPQNLSICRKNLN
jgi:ATP-dependent DNA helicase RecG